jgi:uncharacterized protein (TIGR03085 family)
MTTFAGRERAALCKTLLAVGPEGPTLCEGWTARDLAAHLVLREHAPVGSLGIWFNPLAGYTERLQRELASQPWERLVEQVAGPPALWHPARLAKRIERTFDDGEMFVHHEDLRRGDGVARPRELSDADEESLWQVLIGTGRLAFRKSTVGILVDVPGREPVQLHKNGDRDVTLRGAVGEVLLAAYGRGRAAIVEIDGQPEDVLALGSSALGL